MEIREKILAEASRLFIQNGIRLVTMDTIAQSLGISKRTIYENFKDKNDLLRNSLISNALIHKKKLLDILKNADNVIEALFTFGEYNRDTYNKVNPAFFVDIKKYHSELFRSVINSENIKNYEISYTLLKRGVNEGIFVKTIDIEIANLFIHNTIEFFQRYEQTQCIEHDKIWTTVFFPYLKGICTGKGVDLLNSFIQKHQNL
jgi:TetR/AcrR family transcriptional regulator, cholesterol catabolism regulator